MRMFREYEDITDSHSESCDELFELLLSDKRLSQCLSELREFDYDTYVHSLRVFHLSYLVGSNLLYKEDNLRHLGLAALLHDIGKTKVEINILNKPDRLTKGEFDSIKLHSLYGCHLAACKYFTPDVIKGIIEHHERGDGSGYPFGLTNEEISNYGCIIATCDVFDAITSKRVYRSTDYAVSEAITYLRQEEVFDSTVINIIESLNKNETYTPKALRKDVS